MRGAAKKIFDLSQVAELPCVQPDAPEPKMDLEKANPISRLWWARIHRQKRAEGLEYGCESPTWCQTETGGIALNQPDPRWLTLRVLVRAVYWKFVGTGSVPKTM